MLLSPKIIRLFIHLDFIHVKLNHDLCGGCELVLINTLNVPRIGHYAKFLSYAKIFNVLR